MKEEKTLQLLVKKVENIERTVKKIESELDEVIYPSEERIKKSYIEKVERAAKEGKYKHFKSPKDFFEKLENENV